MGQKLHNRINVWKKLLLDFGKRNRLINFRESKRSNILITSPTYETLFDWIAIHEKEIVFPYAKNICIDDEGEETYETIIEGNVETSKSIGEQQKTLQVLRYRANTSIEEQGINILFLSFGLLKWKEKEDSSYICSSPIILVPVRLTVESLTSPYKLVPHEDEIVVNPTLLHKLSNDFGIELPEFDSVQDNIKEYFQKIEHIVGDRGWSVECSVNLTHLSFLKINMYKDLERNEEKLNKHHIIAAIVGEHDPIHIPNELNNFDHDRKVRPIDTFQVVDADSSQQDAVLLSKKGVSFVLQGPPGTGKSQTITNIISEALADGRKVLFVSEKMAALQVVYNRLANVGLSDFCFTLHSHKANKKEILRELSNSISIDKKKVREEAIAQLNNLEHTRSALNEYEQELHTPCSGLNTTIFNINGKLAKLGNVPDIIFEIADVEKMTQSELFERVNLLEELSKTMGKRSENYIDNVWRNSIVDFLSNELRHDIDSNISEIIPLLNGIERIFTSRCTELDVSIQLTWNGVKVLDELLQLVGKSPLIPIRWIYDDDINSLSTQAEEYKKETQYISGLKEEILNKYGTQAFEWNSEQFKVQLREEMQLLMGKLQQDNKDELAKNLEVIQKEISTIEEYLSEIFRCAYRVAYLLGIIMPSNKETLESVALLSQTIFQLSHIIPTLNWFDKEEFFRIKKSVNICKTLHNEVVKMRHKILQKFDKEIFELDYYPILQRFRSQYNSLFRIFNKSYKTDIRILKKYSSSGLKLTYREAFELLNTLKYLADKVDVIKSNKEQYQTDFGRYYNGIETQWEVIETDLYEFEEKALTIGVIPNQLRNMLIEDTIPKSVLNHFNELYNESSINEKYSILLSLFREKYSDKTSYEHIEAECKLIQEHSTPFILLYNSLVCDCKKKIAFNELIEDLEKIAYMKSTEEDLEVQKVHISKQYGNYYSGIETDWDKLLEALAFAKDFKLYVDTYALPKSFVYKICNEKQSVAYCKTSAEILTPLIEAVNIPLNWFFSLFASTENLSNYDLIDLVSRLRLCQDKKHLLEEWIDYHLNKEKCEKIGLASFVKEIEEKSVNTNYIVGAYLKRFYRLWLDAMLLKFPSVRNFRGRKQNQTIEEFCKLDKEQFKIAQARVRECVVARMPDFNSITSTHDEIGVLKRELNKQRRLMPLRKLFMTIPNLITSLRPCFMMSPLSVSVFLEAQSYDFDLVIFDEASQVHTEDAIGAIMRGKQVIIVGDTKQLPPTNFFATSLNDEDFDNDSNEENKDNDADAFESILDEAITVLPERSLRWHYRSRHEHLIAFSNIKIYNGSLITFPSSTEKAPDCGVEYIHVPDGIYDRSGKRNNMIEAKHVAQLVFNHFRKYPNRSLGVVTFSEAQQNAIDSAIRQLRNQNSMFEQFFNEERNEPFFIKNLENVQGDERDTIIFSIGYAKDNKGIMYMNFGPLSRNGGYRRLNVAITRAKHNVKLVGSIVPTDIDLEKTSAEGVRLLRSYIEFAQQGVSALEKELTFNYNLDFDSPFEEAVYDFLSGKGYNTVTQVGCSGFRIDMAVKHPTQNGKFAIGIECDGATYHSSRTARERDRLRQSVLENMGWTIYRIWSTDWIKDQTSEEEKLIAAVEKALGKVIEVTEPIAVEDVSDSDLYLLEIEEKVETTKSVNGGYGFVVYQQADPFNYVSKEKWEIVKEVVTIEQPIHFEELCRRMAPVYERQKVTSVIRDDMKRIFRYYLKTVIVEDKNSFITLHDFDDLKVRIPNSNGEYLRSIAYISDEEIALAMKTVVQHSCGITPEDLFIITAREFGFKRTGENIIISLRRVYKNMLRNGQVKEIDGKVSVN